MMEELDLGHPAVLFSLMKALEPGAALFSSRYDKDLATYRASISLGIDSALDVLKRELDRISGGNRLCIMLAEQIEDYVSWMQWSLWDLPYFAISIRPEPEHFRKAVAACGMVYIAIRIFDDIIDQHFSYKGRHATLMETLRQSDVDSKQLQGLTILSGLLLCFEGFYQLLDADRETNLPILHRVLDSLRRTVIGAMLEYSSGEDWSMDFYNRLVALKNVDYWHSIYAALDPDLSSPLYPFWIQYYDLAQNLNDVQDYDEDLRRAQPNLLAVMHSAGNHKSNGCPPFSTTARQSVSAEVAQVLEEKIQALIQIAEDLPDPERQIARFKLYESLKEAYRLGVFPDASDEEDSETLVKHRARLFWFSDIQEVIQEAGLDAIEEVDCPVCQSDQRTRLFQKQGFSYNRCQNCTHVYVSPRITAATQHLMLDNLDNLSMEDKYLEVQRVYAESICYLLSLRVSGTRLLDIGFGHGYLLQMARAYNFEAYGIDGSLAHVENLQSLFGGRVAHCVLGRSPIPWKEFDVVVMSHILEHMPNPDAVLHEVRGILNPDGLLYVTVPDIGSAHFKIFGKHWDVITPTVHYQYFSEGSLTKLLKESGFEQIEKINFPPLPENVLPRWMRLMRQIGGSETSEITYLAKVSK